MCDYLRLQEYVCVCVCVCSVYGTMVSNSDRVVGWMMDRAGGWGEILKFRRKSRVRLGILASHPWAINFDFPVPRHFGHNNDSVSNNHFNLARF